MSRLYCGTSGWIYPHWKSVFYPNDVPQSQWLRYYARHFDTVEINNSFYRLPEPHTFQRWHDEAPDGFTFTVKASRYLTHMKKLKDPKEPLGRVLANSEPLAEKRGPILYQLPPYWHANLPRLEEFLRILPEDIRHVMEFRDESWQCGEVWELLRRYNVAYCVMDSPGLPRHLLTTADFSYIRMHGGGTDGDYPDDYLQWYAGRITEMLDHGDVYIYFNNDLYGYALRNAETLLNIVR